MVANSVINQLIIHSQRMPQSFTTSLETIRANLVLTSMIPTPYQTLMGDLVTNIHKTALKINLELVINLIHQVLIIHLEMV